jgi:hypothetical protein
LKRDQLHQSLRAARKEAGRDASHVKVSVSLSGEVEQAFKELKGELALRPIYHQLESRTHSDLFLSFSAYCLQVTLKARLRKCASGLTPRVALEKFASIQGIDVHLPTTDGREIVMSRYTQPEKDLCLLLDQMNLMLPEQAPPKICRLESNLH